MEFTIQSGAKSVTGPYRQHNEDRFWVDPGGHVFLVADGMGGQQAGEKASQMAIDLLEPRLCALADETGLAEKSDELIARVRRAVVETNQEIIVASELDQSCHNMGTTVVLAQRANDRILVAGLGDSRAYLVRGEWMEQLTVDHSLAQALFEADAISQEEAREHRFRNVLWKYLGTREVGEGPDVRVIRPKAHDRLLLASDGLTGVVEDEEIKRIVIRHTDPQAAADELVQTAIDNDSRDNVTVVVLFIEPLEK